MSDPDWLSPRNNILINAQTWNAPPLQYAPPFPLPIEEYEAMLARHEQVLSISPPNQAPPIVWWRRALLQERIAQLEHCQECNKIRSSQRIVIHKSDSKAEKKAKRLAKEQAIKRLLAHRQSGTSSSSLRSRPTGKHRNLGKRTA